MLITATTVEGEEVLLNTEDISLVYGKETAAKFIRANGYNGEEYEKANSLVLFIHSPHQLLLTTTLEELKRQIKGATLPKTTPCPPCRFCVECQGRREVRG